MKRKIAITLILAMMMTCFAGLTAFAGINYNGGAQTWTGTLSNGHTVRIEYHYGQPHVHDDSTGAAENIADGSSHDKKPTLDSKTRDIVKGKNKNPSGKDKTAAGKYKEHKDQIAAQQASVNNESWMKAHKSEIKQGITITGVGAIIVAGVIVGIEFIMQYWWVVVFA